MNARLILFLILAAVMTVSWLSTCVIYRAAEIGEMIAPIPERDFGEIGVVVVGSGGGYENPERMGPSIAIGWGTHVVLVDSGRGVAEALRRAAIPLDQPDTVLLSSLMPENTVGLDDLLLTGWRLPREAPLRVIGPTGTAELTAGILAAHRRGIEAEGSGLGLPAAGAEIEVLEIGDGWSEERDGMKIIAGALPGGPTPALAYRFERGGRSVVVATTGWAQDAVVEFASEANLLFHESVYIPPPEDVEEAGVLTDPERLIKEASLHTALDDVGNLARAARVDTLALVRMRPPPFYQFQIKGFVGKSFDGTVIIPEDGEEVEP
jgi:ribonuclease BN (tRNA processing enzyme)